MKFTLGFSPCPNDTFIFDALVHHKIDTEGLAFDVLLEDVETLNRWALQTKLAITKLSFPAFFQSRQHYQLLNTGSALGKGVGPLLVKKENTYIENVNNQPIALPGENTTANLLFSFAYPAARQKTFMRFDEIENYVLRTDALGVLIHESRFTYQEKGLEKIIDLGEVWETKMKLPIPLGSIAVNNSLDKKTKQQIDRIIKKSLQFAFENYPTITPYVRQHAQAMSEEVMRQHIDLYVNNFSLDLGLAGKNAVYKLFEVYAGLQTGTMNSNFFVEEPD